MTIKKTGALIWMKATLAAVSGNQVAFFSPG
jgi:hypothetical protein